MTLAMQSLRRTRHCIFESFDPSSPELSHILNPEALNPKPLNPKLQIPNPNPEPLNPINYKP